MISREDMTYERLGQVLDGAGLDWATYDDGSIYVTSGPVGTWVRIEEKRGLVAFSTYWALRGEAEDGAALRLANRCNEHLVLVQFSICGPGHRLCGTFHLPFHEGLDPRTFLRINRMFMESFMAAVTGEDREDLLAARPGGEEAAVLN